MARGPTPARSLVGLLPCSKPQRYTESMLRSCARTGLALAPLLRELWIATAKRVWACAFRIATAQGNLTRSTILIQILYKYVFCKDSKATANLVHSPLL